MKKEIVVVVRDKTAIANENVSIVCGNNDYNVVFQFDDDWKNYPAKTALFVFNDKTIAVPFDGDVCDGVAIEGATICAIGVYAGNLVTTTPAYINCVRSIRDIGNTPKDPTPDVYDKLMALINEYLQEQLSFPKGGAKGQFLSKKSDDDYDTEWVDIELPENDSPSVEVVQTTGDREDAVMSQKSTTDELNVIDAILGAEKFTADFSNYSIGATEQQVSFSLTHDIPSGCLVTVKIEAPENDQNEWYFRTAKGSLPVKKGVGSAVFQFEYTNNHGATIHSPAFGVSEIIQKNSYTVSIYTNTLGRKVDELPIRETSTQYLYKTYLEHASSRRNELQKMSSSAVAYSVALRTTDGRLLVGDPVSAKDATTKDYVDNVDLFIEKRLTNIEAYEEKENIGLFNSVPLDTVRYARIKEIGGKSAIVDGTVKSSPVTSVESVGANLLPYPYLHVTENRSGVDFTVNADGSVTAVGTATANVSFIYTRTGLALEHGKTYSISSSTIISYTDATGATKYAETKVTWDEAYVINQVYSYVRTGAVSKTFYPMVSLMEAGYGYNGYAPYVKRTFEIPANVQSLSGYGQSDPNNPDVYNKIEWRDNGRYYVKVGEIVNGSWVSLEAPQEIDISNILPADNFIEVEPCGRINVISGNGYAVPFFIGYRKDINVTFDGKLDKVTNSNQKTLVYGVTDSNTQTMYHVDRGYSANSIARRDSDGTIATESPTKAHHATTKAYVDARTVQISLAIPQYTWENLGQVGADANTQTSWGILLSDLGITDVTKYKSMNWSRYATGTLVENGSQTGFADMMEYGVGSGGKVQIASGRLVMILGAQSPADVYYDGDLRITLFA